METMRIGLDWQLLLFFIPWQMATTMTSGGSRETTSGGGWQRRTSVRGGGGGEGWYDNQNCCYFYHTGADEKVWGGGDEGWSLSLSLPSLTLSFFITRPKSAYGQLGLDWDCRARIQFSQVHFGVFSMSRYPSHLGWAGIPVCLINSWEFPTNL